MAQAVREVMSADCQCVGENETVITAARKIKKLDVGSMPICGDDDRLKGMLTDRDIVVKVLAEDRDPASHDRRRPGRGQAGDRRRRRARSTRPCGRWLSTRCDASLSSTTIVWSGSWRTPMSPGTSTRSRWATSWSRSPRSGLVVLEEGLRLKGGRCQLEQRLGAGAAASVWLAQDTLLERPVAIKVLAEGLAADRAWLARFRREARVAAGLQHPNLVSVYDFNADVERPYLVMAYVLAAAPGPPRRRRETRRDAGGG